MIEPGGSLYIWVKALHVIAIIAWMAGILYLPRLFVYHSDAPVGSPQSETFKLMERRLYFAIMTPAMIVALFTGFWMSMVWWSQGWMHVKFLGVLLIFASHIAQGRWLSHFAQDQNQHTSKFYRIVNEIPTVAMMIVVIMVIVKPF